MSQIPNGPSYQREHQDAMLLRTAIAQLKTASIKAQRPMRAKLNRPPAADQSASAKKRKTAQQSKGRRG
jgi:hypothetical protein